MIIIITNLEEVGESDHRVFVQLQNWANENRPKTKMNIQIMNLVKQYVFGVFFCVITKFMECQSIMTFHQIHIYVMDLFVHYSVQMPTIFQQIAVVTKYGKLIV